MNLKSVKQTDSEELIETECAELGTLYEKLETISTLVNQTREITDLIYWKLNGSDLENQGNPQEAWMLNYADAIIERLHKLKDITNTINKSM